VLRASSGKSHCLSSYRNYLDEQLSHLGTPASSENSKQNTASMRSSSMPSLRNRKYISHLLLPVYSISSAHKGENFGDERTPSLIIRTRRWENRRVNGPKLLYDGCRDVLLPLVFFIVLHTPHRYPQFMMYEIYWDFLKN
jgi:hypothetical protein